MNCYYVCLYMGELFYDLFNGIGIVFGFNLRFLFFNIM